MLLKSLPSITGLVDYKIYGLVFLFWRLTSRAQFGIMNNEQIAYTEDLIQPSRLGTKHKREPRQ